MIAEILRDRREVNILAGIFAGGPGSGCRGDNCGRPRGVKMTYQSPKGFTYTLFRPSRKGIAKGSHAWHSGEDKFKGKYTKTAENVRPFDLKTMSRARGSGSVYDAKYGKIDKYGGHGKTIFVHKDFKNMRVVVQEVPHDEMNKSEVMRSVKFKSFGKAAEFLNKHYGIRQKMMGTS